MVAEVNCNSLENIHGCMATSYFIGIILQLLIDPRKLQNFSTLNNLQYTVVLQLIIFSWLSCMARQTSYLFPYFYCILFQIHSFCISCNSQAKLSFKTMATKILFFYQIHLQLYAHTVCILVYIMSMRCTKFSDFCSSRFNAYTYVSVIMYQINVVTYAL